MKKVITVLAITGLVFSMQSFASGSHRKGLGSQHSKAEKAERKERKAQRQLEKLDTSGDGQVDLNEYLAHAQERFASTDANSDGYITPEEMRAWSKAKRLEIKEARKARKEAEKAQ